MGLKMTMGILADPDKYFTPLPKEQQLTEESLIALERRIAKASRKNEAMLEESYRLAEKSTLVGPVNLDD